jgi:hypothetical protein
METTIEQQLQVISNAIKNINDITSVLIDAIDSLDESDDKYGFSNPPGSYRLLYGIHTAKGELEENVEYLKTTGLLSS